MADGDNAISGGLLVILGIIVAVVVGMIALKSGAFNSSPTIKVELPKVER